MEAGLSDQLRLLTGGRRVDERHRSLRSTLDWSCALLAPPDQAMLRRASLAMNGQQAGDAALLNGCNGAQVAQRAVEIPFVVAAASAIARARTAARMAKRRHGNWRKMSSGA